MCFAPRTQEQKCDAHKFALLMLLLARKLPSAFHDSTSWRYSLRWCKHRMKTYAKAHTFFHPNTLTQAHHNRHLPQSRMLCGLPPPWRLFRVSETRCPGPVLARHVIMSSTVDGRSVRRRWCNGASESISGGGSCCLQDGSEIGPGPLGKGAVKGRMLREGVQGIRLITNLEISLRLPSGCYIAPP